MRQLLFSLVLAVLLGASVLPAHALKVVATTSDLGYFAREIGGDKVTVHVICPGTANPHFVETKPSDARAVAQAEVFLEIGLALEVWAAPLRRAANNPRLRVVTTSAGVPVLEKPTGTVDPSQGHTHPSGNPHIWHHPNAVMRICSNILAGFRAADPANADYYTQRTRNLLTRIQSESKKWQQQAAKAKGQNYVSYHASYEYLADFLGLNKAGTIEPKPGVPPTSRRVTEVINLVKARNVRLIFQEPFYPAGAGRSVAAATTAKLLILPTATGGAKGADDWFKLMDHNVAQIVGALK